MRDFPEICKLLVHCLVFFLPVVASFGQDNSKLGGKDWITFSPPSGSFTIRLPAPPEYEINKWESAAPPKNEASIFECACATNYFRLPSTFNSAKYRLVIREIDVMRCDRRGSDFNAELLAFIRQVAGGEPALKIQEMNEDGMKGAKDIRFESGAYYPGTNNSPIYNRILAGDAGKKIFILMYFREEGTMGEEAVIFQSFKPKNTRK